MPLTTCLCNSSHSKGGVDVHKPQHSAGPCDIFWKVGGPEGTSTDPAPPQAASALHRSRHASSIPHMGDVFSPSREPKGNIHKQRRPRPGARARGAQCAHSVGKPTYLIFTLDHPIFISSISVWICLSDKILFISASLQGAGQLSEAFQAPV